VFVRRKKSKEEPDNIGASEGGLPLSYITLTFAGWHRHKDFNCPSSL